MVFRAQAETLPSGATPLPASAYRSEDVLEAELERIFLMHWLCVGRTDQLDEAGSYVALEVGDERVLIVRGDDGRLAAFDNVCRHRGTILCTEPAGNVGAFIRCPFHAWTYALDGRLVHAPLMEHVDGFDPAAFPLQPVATAEWEGFVFVHLGADPEPFASAWADVFTHFERWSLGQLRVARQTEYVIEANWKLVVENYSECYHCPSIHPRFADRCAYRSGQNDFHAGPFLGGFMELRPGYPTLSMSGDLCAAPRTGLDSDDLGRVYFYALFPNLLLSLHPDYAVAYTLWPETPERTRVQCVWLFAAPDTSSANRTPYEPDDAFAFWDEANREDFTALRRVQEGLRTRRQQPAPYSQQESLAAAFDEHVTQVLGRR